MSIDDYERSIRQQIADMQARHRAEITPLVDALIQIEATKTAPSFCISIEQAKALRLLEKEE